ncbi:MAG: efflux RND transporter permease subunit [Calditrichia bacterium]
MRNMVKHFIKYPILGNSIIALVMVFAFFAYQNMKTTFFPERPSRNILITASYPGASPEEIEEGITTKIEDNLKGLTGIDRVTSTSSENAVTINIELKSGVDPNVILLDVQNAVDKVTSFPVGMEQLNVYKLEPTDFVLSFALSGNLPLKELKTYARRVERDLLSYPQISKVELQGFPSEEIEISVKEKVLQAYNLTFTEVANAVSSTNLKITGGKIKGHREEYLIRADNKGYYAKDLENIVVRSGANGEIVYLRDVARVIDRWSENPQRSYFNGKPAITVDVMKTNQEDMFEIADIVKEYIASFNTKHQDVQIDLLRDGSRVVKERADILKENGILGIILVVLFLSLALNPRIALWVAIGIPFSFAGMLMLGPLYGLTINVMSLLAMILVIGILVDDGIVIAESIYQEYEKGKRPIPAALDGTLKVLPAVVSSILTTVLVFATFLFLEGGLGERARDISFVVIATLLISLVEAIFILPAHIGHSKALRQPKNKHSWLEKKSEATLGWLRDRLYAPALRFVIKRPTVGLATAIAIFLITIGAVQGRIIKITFFPNLEFDNFNITLEMPAGTSDRITDSLLVEVEEKVWQAAEQYNRQHPEEPPIVQNIGRYIGSGTHQGRLRVTLSRSEDRSISSAQATAYFRNKIGPMPLAEKFQVGGGTRWGMPVSIALKSDNIDQLRQASAELKSALKEVNQLKDVIDDNPPGLKEVKIKLKQKALALGFTTSQVMSQVRAGFFGKEAQRILRGIDEVRIWVRYAENERRDIDQLRQMRIRTPDGRAIPLSELADLSIERGIMSISHIDGQRVVKVEADLANPDESVISIIQDIRRTIMPDIIAKYPDVRFDFEGQSRENKKTTSAMAAVVPPILFMMFMIIVVTFRSFLQAGLVFLLLPFSLVGVAWGHYFQGFILSMLSLFGTIALMGIVVNDSLVLLSAMNDNLKSGQKFREALFNAGISRFRPVLLTSLTTILGLGPLMFEPSFQAQFLSPMAIAVAYGLLFGTVLTLLLLPSLLVIANRIKVILFSLIRRSPVAEEEVEPAIRQEIFVHEQEASK